MGGHAITALPLLVNETVSQSSQPPLSTYAYSYPHKSSYRTLRPAVRIAAAWRDEDVSQLSLYAHIPFCEMRCGFCNLFTQSQPATEVVDAYLQVLQRQMRVVRAELPSASFSQFAIGGGTPTLLSAGELECLLTAIEATFELKIQQLPTSIETSPATATRERLRVLTDFGVQRVSIGVQSFDERDCRRMGRPQQMAAVHDALTAVRDQRFPVLNIDLIYGALEQTPASWRASLRAALQYKPEELYLYPLYVRPETGLARAGHAAVQHRGDLYALGRDLLLGEGYVQTSLRCFRLPGNIAPSTYACQRDGMVGLGCGARSYTRRLHYASRFAVTQAGVRSILAEWMEQSDDDLALATHGIELSLDEQRRRFLIMSLLQAEGFPVAEYCALFQSSPWDDLPELEQVEERGWLETDGRDTNAILRLTEIGLEHSDEVAPLLYSPAVRQRLRECTQ